MINKLIQWFIGLFARRIAAFISAAILAAVVQGFAWLAEKSPELAALCNPQEIAGWLSTLAVTLLFIAANKVPKAAGAARKVAEHLQSSPPEVVMKAQPVNPD